MKPDATDLPEVLRQWRERKNHTIEVAAKKLGVAPATWSHWETGARFPNTLNLTLLARMLDVPVLRLLCVHAEICPLRNPCSIPPV